MKFIVLVLAIAFAPVALAAPPAAPVVTVGASNVKQLQFDWPSVPGVGTYELWFRAAPGAEWVKFTETPAGRRIIRINVSVHLLDWRVARYRVAACNPSGCTNSAEVGVSDLALDAVGYLKPVFTGEDRWFGGAVAMSADGMTAAVATADQAGYNGSVYLYRKPSSSAAWRLEARLIPSLYRRGTGGNNGLAVNGDGTLVAFGRQGEGIDGKIANGAVYLFRRNGSTWKQEKRLASSVPKDYFGAHLDLDDSGNTLAIWHRADSAAGSGVTEIYNHSSAGWLPVTSIPVPPYPGGGVTFCESLALSGDGQTLVRNCGLGPASVLVHKAPGWGESARIIAGDNTYIDTNVDGTLFVVFQNTSMTANVYRLQQNVWSLDSGSPLRFGIEETSGWWNFAMSRDGKIIAIGNSLAGDGPAGPNYPPAEEDGTRDGFGSVHVFERKPAGWTLRRLMRPGVEAHSNFGNSVALGANGKNMIVGAFEDDSGARGINGDPDDTSAPGTGAAWVY